VASPIDFAIRLGLVGTSQVVTGLNQAIELVGRVGQSIARIAREVDEYNHVIHSHSVSVEGARAATDGLIESIELHRGAARLQAAGVQVTERQMRSLAVAATDFARRTGGDATQAFENLSQAVIRGEAEGLRPYGVSLEGLSSRGERLARTLSTIEGRFAAQTIEANTLSESVTSLGSAWSDAWHEMALTLTDESTVIGELLNGVAEGLVEVTRAMQAMRRLREEEQRAPTTARIEEINRQLAARGVARESTPGAVVMRDDLSALQQAGVGVAGAARSAFRAWDFATQGQGGAAWRELGRGGLDEANRLLAERERLLGLEHQQRPTESALDLDRMRSDAPDRPRRGGGGGGGRADDAISFGQMVDEMAHEAALDRMEELAERKAQDRADEARALETQRDLVQESIDMAEKRAEIEERASERIVEARMQEQAVLEKTTRATEERIEIASTAVDGFIGVMQNFVAVGKTLAGENERATKALMIAEGVFLVAKNIAHGVTEAALAVSSAATYDYKGAVEHGIASAMHFSAAAVSGAELGVRASGASQRSGRGAGARPEATAPGRRFPQDQDRTRRHPIVVNVNGPVTSARVHEELQRLERDGARRSDA
jgi:hypothetical protein